MPVWHYLIRHFCGTSVIYSTMSITTAVLEPPIIIYIRYMYSRSIIIEYSYSRDPWAVSSSCQARRSTPGYIERSSPVSFVAVESSPRTGTLVMHAAPLKYRPGAMRRWIKGDNKGMKILGIRWLLKGDRWGHIASSRIMYMKDLMEVTKLRVRGDCSAPQFTIGIVDTGEGNFSPHRFHDVPLANCDVGVFGWTSTISIILPSPAPV